MVGFYRKTIRWTNEKFSQGLPLTFRINLVAFHANPTLPFPSPPTSTIPVGFLTFQPVQGVIDFNNAFVANEKWRSLVFPYCFNSP